MPRAKSVQSSPAKQLQNNLLWQQTGQTRTATMLDWDPNAQQLAELVFEILSTGYAVTFRAGSGGASLGIQVWTWEDKKPYIWFTEYEELDLWVADLRAGFKKHIEAKTE